MSNSIVLKKIREQQPKFIPLLKVHVDTDDFISHLIKEGQTDGYCDEMRSYIAVINDVCIGVNSNGLYYFLFYFFYFFLWIIYRKLKNILIRIKRSCLAECRVLQC